MKYLEIENESIEAMNAYYKCFDNETGEQIVEDEALQEAQEALAKNKEEAKNYLEYFLGEYREQEASIEGVKKEIERLSAIVAKREKKKENMKPFIELITKKLFNGKFEGLFNTVSFRKSTGLVIDNEDLVDDKFKKRKETISIDKTAITNAIKAGEEIGYAHLEERENLQIK